MERAFVGIPERDFNRVFIVEDRNHWNSCKPLFNEETDLVLVIDLGLMKMLEKEKIEVFYLDNILDRNYLEERNYELHHFLNKWYLDKDGNDIIVYKGVPVGSAYLLNILNDVTYNFHFFIYLSAVKVVSCREIICAVTDEVIKKWVKILFPAARFIEEVDGSEVPAYYFPISAWMEEKMKTDTFVKKIKRWGVGLFEYIGRVRETLMRNDAPAIYLQNYHPTFPIIDELKKNRDVKVIMANYSSPVNALKERRVFYRNRTIPADIIESSLTAFKNRSFYDWKIDGFDIGANLLELIVPKLPKLLQSAFSRIEDIENYFGPQDVRLMVPVTELWLENNLIINYCKLKGIPVYMIINGLLVNNFSYDARRVDWVNSYSEAIKEDYFGGMDNAICLGDPRMDHYSNQQPKVIDRENPVIIIGAGGYNLIDMNSYLAYEFDFLYDLLEVLSDLEGEGYKHSIVLKVRENGYVSQYSRFLDEYFPHMKVRIEQQKPFKEVIAEADFYLSFYSQTLFEASILGIPALYYKKDQHIINKPFDSKSELVTAFDKTSLKEKIIAFYKKDPIYDVFLKKSVLEKYIGKLDGKNLDRNLQFINRFLSKNRKENN